MKPTKASSRRGFLHYHIEGNEGGLIHIWLGEPHDPESEHIATFHKFYLKDFIALLKLVEEKEL